MKVNKWTPGGTSGVYQADAGGDQEDGVAVTVLGDIADGVYLRGNAGGKDYISGRAGEHLRFDISPDVCSAQDRNVYIDVEYFDNQSDGGFVLYYTDGSDSVSYTHLDVYKRQVWEHDIFRRGFHAHTRAVP